MTTNMLLGRVYADGLPAVTIKTIQRKITQLQKEYKLKLLQEGHDYILPGPDISAPVISKLLYDSAHRDPYWQKVFYGSPEQTYLTGLLKKLDEPAQFIYKILRGFSESRQLSFLYYPQSDITYERVTNRSYRPLTQPKGTILLKILPRFLICSQAEMTVLGETYYGESQAPLVRQFSLSGIVPEKLKVLETAKPRMVVNPDELFRDSLNVWISENKYEVLVEEKLPGGIDTVYHNFTVNGVIELLSHIMASLGSMKIVNPHEDFKREAEKRNLPEELIFKYDENLPAE